MALTADTILAMAPQGGSGGMAAGEILEFTAQDTGIVLGDVVIFNGEDVDEKNGTPLRDEVVGVALETQATTKGLIRVAPAFPGRLFEASIVTSATADETGVAAANIGVEHGIVESTSAAAGFAVIDISDTTEDICRTLFYAKQRNITQDTNQATGGVGILNPRMVFAFNSSVFHVVA